jgi:hypothetical protein
MNKPMSTQSIRPQSAPLPGFTRQGSGVEVEIERLDARAYTVPTDGPDGKESDGTLEWSSTTMVLVEAQAGGQIT